jgi:hypothetical protein
MRQQVSLVLVAELLSGDRERRARCSCRDQVGMGERAAIYPGQVSLMTGHSAARLRRSVWQAPTLSSIIAWWANPACSLPSACQLAPAQISTELSRPIARPTLVPMPAVVPAQGPGGSWLRGGAAGMAAPVGRTQAAPWWWARTAKAAGPALRWALVHPRRTRPSASPPTRRRWVARPSTASSGPAPGTTPRRWLVAQRVLLARRLLETTQLTIEEIAHHSGFGDAALLDKHFTTQTRLTPTAYHHIFGHPHADDLSR